MTVQIAQVDAFTSRPFAGNPAGVCMPGGTRDDRWMQQVAAEMNVAETAFVQPRPDGAFDLRWFTPTVEVDLCGHATLGSAHYLWETGVLPRTDAARFHTRSGLLTATSAGDWIELDFPATPDEPCDAPAGLVEGLGVVPRYVGRSRFDFIVEFESEQAVAGLRPDFRQLRAIAARGVIATSRSSNAERDFVSRYFAPAFGIDEDPVTGSTHCCLGPFWSARLGKATLLAHQISARGGVMKVRCVGDRVRLGGQAVTVIRGELLA